MHHGALICSKFGGDGQLIEEKRVDFAFPVQEDAKIALKDDPDVTLIRAFVSSGLSLIVNIKQCQKESREELLASITSQWPIGLYDTSVRNLRNGYLATGKEMGLILKNFQHST